MPYPMLQLYAATKSTVDTLCQDLRDELLHDDSRVNHLRSGSVKGGSGGKAWSQETIDAFYKKIVATGHAAMTGESATPESMAASLLAVIGLPADIGVDLIEVRAAQTDIGRASCRARVCQYV